MKIAFSAALLAYIAGAFVATSAPRVVVDIAPLHSLTAQVMAGVGEPALILPAGASPHDYAMRPSDAAALDGADIVIRIGGGLTPWFDKARLALAPGAMDLELANAPGVVGLPMRWGGAFGKNGHAHEGHLDPHIWLDPQNAAAAVAAIAKALTAVDPANAAVYGANAVAAEVGLGELTAEINTALAPVRGRPYLVFHDAYQYFTTRFDIPELGAVVSGDAARPSAGRIAEMQALAADAVCIFAEPQFEPRLLETIAENSDARLAVLDPAGAKIEPGPSFYEALLRNLAADLAGCLGG